jgi:hypothetical protein
MMYVVVAPAHTIQLLGIRFSSDFEWSQAL